MRTKDLFSALATVTEDNANKKLALNSPLHWQHWVNKLPLGKQFHILVSEYIPKRTEPQLDYHWVLMGYLADFSGNTKAEIHEVIMREVFGTKTIEIGGMKQTVRKKSISNAGDMTLLEAMGLLEFDLALCKKLNIKVPTKEELGYISNK